jgi:hypothetical protein
MGRIRGLSLFRGYFMVSNETTTKGIVMKKKITSVKNHLITHRRKYLVGTALTGICVAAYQSYMTVEEWKEFWAEHVVPQMDANE